MRSLRLKTFRTVPGLNYGTPKEVWGFRTAASGADIESTAREFLRANADILGLEGIFLAFRKPRILESLGARHFIFQQEMQRVRIHRAYVTVHADLAGRVYLAKNRAVPRELAKPADRFRIGEKAAIRVAEHSVARRRKVVQTLATERLWFPRGTKLRPAYRVRIDRRSPRQEWIVHVDAYTGRVLSRYDNLAARAATGKIFDPNPVIARRGRWREFVRQGKAVVSPDKVFAKAYRTVELEGLDATGYLVGPRVSTELTPRRVRRKDGQFDFDAHERGFDETMVYYHVNAAIRHLESIGFRDEHKIFAKAVPANARGTREDNSYYHPYDKSLEFGSGVVDDAEDGEIMVHELGHAIQDAICPDFGQSHQAAAMGEGFGDYFSASFFADRKPREFKACFGAWDGIEAGGDPPCWRRLDEDLSFEAFEDADDMEHENGQIWSGALWEIWNAIGRRAADRIIIESHYQLDAFTTFARGARAILDADRNLYGGRNVARLARIFQRRGIGPLE